MGRPIKPKQRNLSASVSDKSRELLETTAEKTKTTMSDILDRIIKASLSPKRGLAKRLEKEKVESLEKLGQQRAVIAANLEKSEADAELQLSQARADAEAKLNKAEADAELQLSQARADAELTLKQIQERYDLQVELARSEAERLHTLSEDEATLRVQRNDYEWSNSLQAMLMLVTTGSKEDQIEAYKTLSAQQYVTRWLFDRRIIAATCKFGIQHTSLGLFQAYGSFMSSRQIVDKMLAADLAADTPCIEMSEEAFDYLISNQYLGDFDAAFADFCAGDIQHSFREFDGGPVLDIKHVPGFGTKLQETDSLYGTNYTEVWHDAKGKQITTVKKCIQTQQNVL